MNVPPSEGLPKICVEGFYNSPYGSRIGLVGGAGAIFAVVSLGLGFYWLHKQSKLSTSEADREDVRVAKSLILGAWVLLPPLWFFIEYIYFYRWWGKPECFEAFKYAQDLGSKGWAGMVAVLGVLFFSKDILNKD
jgi:hypothetical protein